MPESNDTSIDIAKDDRDALFKLITEEIKDLNEEDKIKGWTPWVVSATLISMSWLIVQDVWNEQLLVNSIHAVFIVVSLIILLIFSARAAFNAMDPDYIGRGSYLLLHTNTTALNAFVTALWLGTIAAAGFALHITEAGYILIIIGVFFGIEALSALAAVVVMARRIPLPIMKGITPFTIAFICIQSIICIIAIITILKSDAITLARLNDVRVGSLLAFGLFALKLLSQGGAGRPAMKKTLADLRRDLMLGNLPIDEARHHTRVAFEGLLMSDVVREDMRVLLKFISDVRVMYADAFRRVERLKASIPISSPTGAHLTDIEKVAVSNTLDVLETYSERAQNIAKQYFARLRDVRKRLMLASRLVKAATSESEKFMTEIQLAQASADEDLEKFAREFHEVQNAWNLWFPNETRQHEPFGISAKDSIKRQ